MVTKVLRSLSSTKLHYSDSGITLDLDEEEKEEKKALEEKFQPLIEWLKEEAKGSVLDGMDFEVFMTPYSMHHMKSCDFQPPCQKPLRHCCRCSWIYCQCAKDDE